MDTDRYEALIEEEQEAQTAWLAAHPLTDVDGTRWADVVEQLDNLQRERGEVDGYCFAMIERTKSIIEAFAHLPAMVDEVFPTCRDYIEAATRRRAEGFPNDAALLLTEAVWCARFAATEGSVA